LFILAIELSANAVAKANNIKGIIIDNTEINQTHFEDKVSFFTDFFQNYFNTLIKTLDFSLGLNS